MKCTWFLPSLLIYSLISLFSVICLKLPTELEIELTFFDYPWRFELSGVVVIYLRIKILPREQGKFTTASGELAATKLIWKGGIPSRAF